ncbi:MAG: ABC-F family ATP-binding cassette domain-containing protein [Candidatus Peribacteria bacterium]|nr:MAG: ABC-F family ATP-binding cassette domain-containing protein [Candidatus Peribacteria bacterium]
MTITMGMYQQKLQAIDETKKVIDVVRDVAEYITIANGKRVSASQLLELFNFSPEQQRQRAYTLSGGEKRRLHLLTVLIANPNFLILDEPTNDLDIMTMTVLENFLLAYKGCLVVVSHDRFFVDSVVDHLLVFTGDGKISEFPGSYSEYHQSLLHKNTANPEQRIAQATAPQTADLLQEQAQKKKSLNNKEREEFTFVGTEIERLENQRSEITLRMETQELDHQAIKEIGKQLATIAEKLELYEERWLELAERG